jgi:hypothetical protein
MLEPPAAFFERLICLVFVPKLLGFEWSHRQKWDVIAFRELLV